MSLHLETILNDLRGLVHDATLEMLQVTDWPEIPEDGDLYAIADGAAEGACEVVRSRFETWKRKYLEKNKG